MPRFKYALWLSLTAALAALSLGACGGDDDDDDANGTELRDVTLMLDYIPNTHHAGIYIAQREGYYEDAGLNVTIIEPAATGVEQVVGNGQADFGVSYQEFVIPARGAGIPVVSIAAIKQHNDSSLVSLAEDGIARPADLAGHTYGGFGGPLETQLIRQLVECDGGDPDSVTLLEAGSPGLIGLQDDDYDFVWIFESWDAIQWRDIDGVDLNSLLFIDYTDCIPDWYTPLLITSEDMIANNPETVRAFLAATTRGYEAAIADPDLVTATMTEALPEINEELVQLSAEYHSNEHKYVDEGRQWGLQDEAIWTGFTTFLLEAGLIDEEIDVPAAWTNDFLPEE
jgi:ABC-type nitrate/sulfonate/bicarbonate transport system substrate-binding protein